MSSQSTRSLPLHNVARATHQKKDGKVVISKIIAIFAIGINLMAITLILVI
jgi:hypothetical protein